MDITDTYNIFVLIIQFKYNMSIFKFRPAKASDSKLLSVLFKTVYIETYGTEGITLEFANFIEQQFSPTKIERDIESESSDLWLATHKNNPVGVVQIEYNKPCPISDLIGPEINKLYILRNFFTNGIGQNLMKIAEDQIRKKGQDNVWLWVLEANTRANEFYYKQGFKNIGLADFQMEENSYTNNVMLKHL